MKGTMFLRSKGTRPGTRPQHLNSTRTARPLGAWQFESNSNDCVDTVFDRNDAKTIENGAETIGNSAETIEDGAETMDNSAVFDRFGGTHEVSI